MCGTMVILPRLLNGVSTPKAEAAIPTAETLTPTADAITSTADALTPLAEALTPLAVALTPLAEAITPLAEAIIPLAEAIPSLAGVIPPLVEAITPLVDVADQSIIVLNNQDPNLLHKVLYVNQQNYHYLQEDVIFEIDIKYRNYIQNGHSALGRFNFKTVEKHNIFVGLDMHFDRAL